MLGFEGGSLELAELASSDRSMDLVQDQHSSSTTPLNEGSVHIPVLLMSSMEHDRSSLYHHE